MLNRHLAASLVDAILLSASQATRLTMALNVPVAAENFYCGAGHEDVIVVVPAEF